MMIEEELSDNQNIRTIYNRFNRKVILKVIDASKKYTFFKMTVLLCFLVLGFFSCGVLYKIGYSFGKYNVIILGGIFFAFAIFGIGFSYTKFYFKNNKMIIRNLFVKIMEIDLNKYPRTFTKAIEHKRRNDTHYYPYKAYYIYFQQNEKSIKIRLYFNNIKKIQKILENLQVAELDLMPENERLMSASSKEKVVEEYIKIRQGKRIIGIKNTNKKTILKKAPTMVLIVLWIIFFIGIVMSCYFNNELKKNGIGTWGAILLEIAILFIILLVIYNEYSKIIIRICYPDDNTIKVKNKEFHYKSNIVTISFYKYIYDTLNNRVANSLNDYILKIEDDKGNYLYTDLGQSNAEDLNEFLENIEQII